MIVFPVYIEDQKHWLAMRIDFAEKEVSFSEFLIIECQAALNPLYEGDLLVHEGMPSPKLALKQIQT